MHWLENGSTLQLEVPPYNFSYEWLISLLLQEPPKPKSTPFMFHRMWLSQEYFDEMVEHWWYEENHIYGTAIFSFTTKLQYLKRKMKAWNKIKFGDVTKVRMNLEVRVQQV